MKIDFSRKLHTVGGLPLKWGRSTDADDATLRHVCLEALLNATSIEQLEARDCKVRRWRLAQVIASAEDDVEISLEDVVLLKELIGVSYATAVVGPAFDILEGWAERSKEFSG